MNTLCRASASYTPCHDDSIFTFDECDADLIYEDEREIIDFVQMGKDSNEIKEVIYQRFFIEHPRESIQYLYRVRNADDKFICRVFTFGDAPFVVKEMIDLPPYHPTDIFAANNGKYRWYPELVNHRLASRLLPSRTLAMYAAYASRDLRAFYFVYERGRRLTEDEELERHSEIHEVVRSFNSARLYHLDTKMPNVLLNQRGEVCLHDWGVAMPVRHNVPGDLMFSDPSDPNDADAWDYIRRNSLSAGCMETIQLWAKLCQSRLLFAKITKDKLTLDPHTKCVLDGTFGLGMADLYTFPKWFHETHTVMSSMSSQSTVESFKYVMQTLVSHFDSIEESA